MTTIHPGINRVDAFPEFAERVRAFIAATVDDTQFAGIPEGDGRYGAMLSFLLQGIMNEMMPHYTEDRGAEMIARAVAELTGSFASRCTEPWLMLMQVATYSGRALERIQDQFGPPPPGRRAMASCRRI